MSLATRVCSAISAAIVLLIVGFLIKESLPALSQIGVTRLYSDDGWHPMSDQFNLMPMVAATMITTVGAVCLAAPLGIASAVFSLFYAPRFVSVIYGRLVELLAGIPSVVFGLWGITVLAPMVAKLGGSGQNLLTATLVLSLMILPTVALTAHSALRSVPKEWVNGGAALGFGRWALAWRVTIPAARRGIAVGLLLALTRAMGETMAVLMLAGNVVQFPDSLLSPVRTLTANIAMEMGDASSAHRAVLFLSGLVLIGVVGFMVFLAGMTEGKRRP